jgi:anti-sigma B factor antagonist
MHGQPIVVEPCGRGRYSVRLFGDVDIDEADLLRSAATPIVAGGSDVELDLTEVTFIGSGGLRAIAEAVRAGGPTGAKVTVVAASRIARRALELTGMAALVALPAPGPGTVVGDEAGRRMRAPLR